SYLLLAFGAGAVNAGAFLACERFITHVTGTVTRIGLDVRMPLLMLEYTLVLLAFVVGAMSSVLAHKARTLRGAPPRHASPLVVVAAVLGATAVAGHLGAFGPLGGTVEEPIDFAFLSVIAFAMGLMNASVATSTALAVRTTHMTGPVSDFAVSLATAWLTVGDERKGALRVAALRGGKVVAFAVGAASMVPAVGALGYLAFGIPAVCVLFAALRSFVTRPVDDRALATA
ncbi:MAG: DUF1275 domain-containing protein, partial [Polyangiaceae bacterium]|nr:DUF1275 domain-containing protein [Polyangiaceae bacterium]